MQFYRSSVTRSGAPNNLRVRSVAGNSVTLEWTAGAGLDPALGYVVEGGLTPGSVLGSIPTGATSTVFTFSAPTGAFYLRVRAVAGSTRSAASNEIRVFVNVPAPPEAPANLSGTATGNALQLSWTNNASGGAATAIVLNVTGALTLSMPLAAASRSVHVFTRAEWHVHCSPSQRKMRWASARRLMP